MEDKKFREIIQFAIKREIDSVNFYTQASKMAIPSGTKELFQDFAKAEEGHKKRLEDVSAGKWDIGKIQKIPDLKISDYLVDTELKANTGYADILRVAMKREERSVKLYTDLKEKNQENELNQLFTFLIQEESKHKLYIEKIYDDEILK